MTRRRTIVAPSPDAERSLDKLREHVDTFDLDRLESVDRSRDLVIECPDCGKGVAFRNACPKCGGAAWVPAGKTYPLPPLVDRLELYLAIAIGEID